MILRTASGKEFKVHFHHGIQPFKTRRGKLSARWVTTASLHPAETPCDREKLDDKVVSPCRVLGQIVGTAYCSPKDKFTKPAGRKLALRRAIGQAIPRNQLQDREDLWFDYFAKVGTRE